MGPLQGSNKAPSSSPGKQIFLLLPNGQGSRQVVLKKWPGTRKTDYRSLRYKLIPAMCKQFLVLGLKNEEHSHKMFSLFNSKLYLKWSKFSCNFTARVCIETTGFRKMWELLAQRTSWDSSVSWRPAQRKNQYTPPDSSCQQLESTGVTGSLVVKYLVL